jgi:hypothetical protein
LRSAEIERSDWSKVDLENGYITIDASTAKTNSRRLLPIVQTSRPRSNGTRLWGAAKGDMVPAESCAIVPLMTESHVRIGIFVG